MLSGFQMDEKLVSMFKDGAGKLIMVYLPKVYFLYHPFVTLAQGTLKAHPDILIFKTF